VKSETGNSRQSLTRQPHQHIIHQHINGAPA